MKFKTGELQKEGFTSALVIKFENGLVLRTYDDMVWAGRKKSEEMEKQFQELVARLKEAGFQNE
jgi:hypothetical protein